MFVTTIFVGLIGVSVDVLLKMYSTGPLSTLASYTSDCAWQSSDFMWYCEPRCQEGWVGFQIATPAMLNHNPGYWGRYDCMLGGTRRMCCQVNNFDHTWAGTWYSLMSQSRVNCAYRWNQADVDNHMCGRLECDLLRPVKQSKEHPLGIQHNVDVGTIFANCSKLDIYNMIGSVKAGMATFTTEGDPVGASTDIWIKIGR
ncbi:hypothetical protein DdX_12932 [Ditylenchus destructor]|uniref:Uncharacterized protein n=1 Tax=Ditylenchus destructor TaxID=166010 RepID=A0AAD4MTN7_9BILA|nr:hypothetical protein DdX_12932 [Ditylenchus destructor]